MVEEDEIDSATQPEIKEDTLIPQTDVRIVRITNMTSETNNRHGNKQRESMTNKMSINLQRNPPKCVKYAEHSDTKNIMNAGIYPNTFLCQRG